MRYRWTPLLCLLCLHSCVVYSVCRHDFTSVTLGMIHHMESFSARWSGMRKFVFSPFGDRCGSTEFILCRHFLLKSFRCETHYRAPFEGRVQLGPHWGLVRYGGTHLILLLGFHPYLVPSYRHVFQVFRFSFFPVIFDFDID